MFKEMFNFFIIFAIINIAFVNAKSKDDSLYVIWHDTSKSDSIRFMALHNYTWNKFMFSNPDSLLYYANLEYSFAKEKGLKFAITQSNNKYGSYYYMNGLYVKAYDHYLENLNILNELQDSLMLSATLNNIGLIYEAFKEYDKALEYYLQSLKYSEWTEDKNKQANTLNNIGNIYNSQGKYIEALDYYQKSLKISELINGRLLQAITINNIGSVYLELNDNSLAETNFLKGLEISQDLNEGIITALSKNNLGVLYQAKGLYNEAIVFCKEAYELAVIASNPNQQIAACKCLYKSYRSKSNIKNAFYYLELLIELENEVKLEASAKEIQTMEFNSKLYNDSIFRIEEQYKKQLEYESSLFRQHRVRDVFIGISIIIIFIVIGMIFRIKFLQKTKKLIEKEKKCSEDLLLNILPYEVAQELRNNGHIYARDISNVSIVFTDFTDVSKLLTAQELVNNLNICFTKFDDIVGKYQLEKIKTIGDSYMAAGGLNGEKNSVRNTIYAALEMIDFVNNSAFNYSGCFLKLKMRVGIHTGPVAAGIVGKKKFQYDIWGDAVNIASRMESYGESNKLNISIETYSQIKEEKDFSFQSREPISIGNYGAIKMYFVEKTQKSVENAL